MVAELVDRAQVEPLHLKDNACALAHRYLLNQAIEMTKPNLPSSFSQVSPDTPFFTFIDVLRSKCYLNRLAKVIIKWYDDNANADTNTFYYRFTGKDSRMFLHNFMLVIDVLESGASGKAAKLLHVHAYMCLCLRNAVALFSRVNITEEEIVELKQHCTKFYRGYWLFFNVNPTVWTLGCVVPVHKEDMKRVYGLGLGLNSMEGREAKHIAKIPQIHTDGNRFSNTSIFLLSGYLHIIMLTLLLIVLLQEVLFLILRNVCAAKTPIIVFVVCRRQFQLTCVNFVATILDKR